MKKNKYIKIKHFLKSRSNSCNKAENKCLKLKLFYGLRYSSLETVCDLCLKTLTYKSTEELFKKDEAQKPKFIFENNLFQKKEKKTDLELQQKALD